MDSEAVGGFSGDSDDFQLNPIVHRRRFFCDNSDCHKSFSRKSDLQKHVTKFHLCKTQSDSSSKFPCEECHSLFASKSILKQHRAHMHGLESDHQHKNFTCSECSLTFHNRTVIIQHYCDSHSDIELNEEHLTFESWDTFYKWKQDIEKQTASRFVKECGSRLSKYGLRHNFSCHRSGKFVSCGSGKRALKISGSHKTGKFCPARIHATESDNIVNVKYFSTHIGHINEAGRLNLNKQEKDIIAGQLLQGVPMKKVLGDISESFSPSKRYSLTTRKDLHNIAASYSINSKEVLHQQDAVSVNMWVEKMRKENSVLLYKPQGELSSVYPDFTADDFVLAVMTDSQQTIFELYGNDIVCIDSTHGTNKYNIQLTSLIIADSNREGFPIAFLFSNRQHEDIFTVFFQLIKNKVQTVVQPNVFMSDDFPAFYNAWSRVFGNVSHHLICVWHVKRSWAKNLSKITNLEKRNLVLADLTAMQGETDATAFQILLQANVSKFLQDADTQLFGQYFLSHYFSRPDQWAACYRIGCKINTNMLAEAWHKNLKYNSNLNGKAGGRLDKAIASVMDSLRSKLIGRAVSLSRCKLTTKVAQLRLRHQRSLVMSTDDVVYDADMPNRRWDVLSENKTEFYSVNCITDTCNCRIKCDACVACICRFSCSCVDNSVRYNVCKHIHLVCRSEEHVMDESSSNMNTHDINTDSFHLEIVTDVRKENEELEMTAIKQSLNEDQGVSSFQSELDETSKYLLSLLPVLRKCETVEQLQSVKKKMSEIPRLVDAMKQRNSLPAVTSAYHWNQNVVPQRRLYSLKNCAKKSRKVSTSCDSNKTAVATILQFNN